MREIARTAILGRRLEKLNSFKMTPPNYKPWHDAQGRIRCGARCRNGEPCKAPGIGHGNRCKLHGGKSTGPRTAEGRQRALDALARGRRRKFDTP